MQRAPWPPLQRSVEQRDHWLPPPPSLTVSNMLQMADLGWWMEAMTTWRATPAMRLRWPITVSAAKLSSPLVGSSRKTCRARVAVVVWWWCGGGVVVVWWWCGGGVVVVRWWCGGGAVVVWWWCGHTPREVRRSLLWDAKCYLPVSLLTAAGESSCAAGHTASPDAAREHTASTPAATQQDKHTLSPTTEGVAMMPAAMDSLLRSPPDRPRSSSPPGSWPPTCRGQGIPAVTSLQDDAGHTT
jgi:hypothetical protein